MAGHWSQHRTIHPHRYLGLTECHRVVRHSKGVPSPVWQLQGGISRSSLPWDVPGAGEDLPVGFTSPHKRHSAPGWGKGQKAEQASHQPEGVQPDTASQELSGIPWGEMGPTITDSNWKTLKGLTRVSACLTDSRVYSCQREPGDCKLGLFSRCEYICPSPVYIAVLISIHVSESESFLC